MTSLLFVADPQMLPTLWVGTSLGSVIQVIVSIPSSETRLTNPVSVFPSGELRLLAFHILNSFSSSKLIVCSLEACIWKLEFYCLKTILNLLIFM